MKLRFKAALTVLFTIGYSFILSAQPRDSYQWWKPQQVEGKGWLAENKNLYQRLPQSVLKEVPEGVWNLSNQTAGLKITFQTNATEIIVRYITSRNKAMNHMPTTGVSGVDLYSIDKDGNWRTTYGSYSFGDTVKYTYRNIETDKFYKKHGREFHLYLPLYNSVNNLEIGIADSATISHLPPRLEKPIVVYGTSIAQGACASRPGMAWTAILERKLERPLINLGFSGKGKMEKEVMNLLADIDAKIFVLDCMPNMTSPGVAKQELIKRVVEGVQILRSRRPEAPIVLTEHAMDNILLLDTGRHNMYLRTSLALREASEKLKQLGIKKVYVLTSKEINLSIDDAVDGLHPNDLGMQKYADAYEKIIRTVLHEAIGTVTTSTPRIQYRDAASYDWRERHAEVLKLNKEKPPEILFIGNSITHYWSGTPSAKVERGKESWEDLFGAATVRNLGFGWDRIENVLWRVYHDELDGYQSNKIALLIGTNNLQYNTYDEIIEGLRTLLKAVKARQHTAEILLLGLLPRRGQEKRIESINRHIKSLARELGLKYEDPGKYLLKKKNTIDESLFSDGLHPNEQGYQKIAWALKPHFR